VLPEWPATVWAERIEVAVTRELQAALRPALPGWTVCEPGCAGTTAPTTVQVEFTSLDFVRASGRLDARARVTIQAPGAPPRQLQLDHQIVAGGDSPADRLRQRRGMCGRVAGSVAQALKTP
jgi:uncharacterized lipoprotein YmbA